MRDKVGKLISKIAKTFRRMHIWAFEIIRKQIKLANWWVLGCDGKNYFYKLKRKIGFRSIIGMFSLFKPVKLEQRIGLR